MKTARVILLFPLALFRLIAVFLISFYVGSIGWLWLQFFGFSKKLQNWSQKTWGKSILLICGIRTQKNSIPTTEKFILMPNHRSYIDIFVAAAFTPAAFVGKAELKKWPLLKLGAKLTHSIFVSRSELQSLVSTMHKIKERVNSGIPVLLFPEGTTSKGPLTRTFKKGSFKIAADTKIPVIPMAIHYPDEKDAWIDNDTFLGHFFRQMSKPISKVYLKYGSISINDEHTILQKEVKSKIDSMLEELVKKSSG